MNILYKGAAYCLSSLLAGGGALLNPALTLALAVVRQVAIISQSFASFYQYLYSPFFHCCHLARQGSTACTAVPPSAQCYLPQYPRVLQVITITISRQVL